MKVIYIGGNHAGTLSMKELKLRHPEVEITLYDENNVTSFLACGIALSVSGVVKNMNDLFYSSPSDLEKDGINVFTNHKIIKINKQEKTILVQNLNNNKTFLDTYDKLVIATGSWPIIPPISGINASNIYLSKTYQQAQKLLKIANDENIKNVAIIGAGYIGIELVEAFSKKGKNVTLVDSCSTLLDKYYNFEFSQEIVKKLHQNKVNIMLNETVESFDVIDNKAYQIKLKSNKTLKTDLVVMCVGFRPNTDMFKDTLELTSNGAIKVDEYRYTSDKNILAIGDCATIINNATNDKHAYIALASNAIRTGICAANNIFEKKMPLVGVQGANGICVFGIFLSSVGVNKTNAIKYFNIEAEEVFYEDNLLPEFMQQTTPVKVNISYELKTGRIIGAQLQSTQDIHLATHFFSLAIQEQKTLEELLLTDLLFLPHYNKPLNFIFMAIMKARNYWLENK